MLLNKYLTILISFIIIGFLPLNIQAAESGAMSKSMQDLSVVVGIGLGGAILGLSTLSFVEEPKDHLKNIIVGGSIGIIIGVGVIAWGQATKSQSMYQDAVSSSIVPSTFDTSSRVAWHRKSFKENSKSVNMENPSFLFSFNY